MGHTILMFVKLTVNSVNCMFFLAPLFLFFCLVKHNYAMFKP